MSDPLVSIVNRDNNHAAIRYPYPPDETVASLIDELLNGGFLHPSRTGHQVVLQPAGRLLDPNDRIATLPLDVSCNLEISNRPGAQQTPAGSGNPLQASTGIANVLFTGEREQQTPCVLVLDHSASMAANDKINHLNAALQVFADHLAKNENTRRRVKILVVKCGGRVEKPSDWVDAADFSPPTLEPTGSTPLGQAVALALDEIDQLKARYKNENRPYTRPVVILMTDGQPTDAGWEEVAQRSQGAALGKHAQVWPVPIVAGGSDVDLDVLRMFKAPKAPMMSIKSPANFAEFFEFLEEVLKGASTSAPGMKLEIPIEKDNPNSPKIEVFT